MNIEERKRRIYSHLIGIYNLSPKSKEPYFSKAPCECCKSELAGDRYEFTGRVGVEHGGTSGYVNLKEKVDLSCCVDCFLWLFSCGN